MEAENRNVGIVRKKDKKVHTAKRVSAMALAKKYHESRSLAFHIGAEKKSVFFTNEVVPGNNIIFQCINTIYAGDGTTQRIGLRVLITSWQVQCSFIPRYSPDEETGSLENYYRMTCFYSTAPYDQWIKGGVVPPPPDLYYIQNQGDPSKQQSFMYPNMDYKSNWKVLAAKNLALPHWGSLAYGFESACDDFMWNHYQKCALPVTFSGNQNDDISSGVLFLTFAGAMGTLSHYHPLKWSARITYVDV